MSSSIEVIVTGFVGDEPQVRAVGEQMVASFSVAVSRKRADGTKLTLWLRVNCWGKLSEIASLYVHKGSHVQFVAEWLRLSAWTDQRGNPQPSVDVDATRLVLLDRVGERQETAHNDTSVPGESSVSDIPF